MTDETDDAPVLPAAKGRRAPVARKQMVTRLWRAAKAQLDAHEAHLAELPAGKAASETDAKTLATLARTVRELLALDATTAGQGGKPEDDVTPADGLRRLAGVRQELACRLAGLAAEEAAAAAAAPAGDGER
ncbi:hypothetical protein [Bosea sp. (in: a-proteobacteria)]|uniref:hypothetical protein n=1 Tax=Bosea sp. (in: a-proteobacteria) TaxID=1871050 RepID=UPI002FC6F1D6